MLELLHDAAFHLERGDDDRRVREEVSRIRGMAGGAGLEPLLERIQSALDSDGGRLLEAEQIRAELHLSGCISNEAHQRFHRALPPVR